MKIIKFCHYCGKKYYIDKSQKNRSRFCSDECFRKSRNTQTLYQCDYCRRDFLVKKSKIDKRLNGESKYLCCSTECAKNIQKPKWEEIVDLFNERGYILKSTEYVNAKTKLMYVCPKHEDCGDQYITYNNLKCGYGCRYCGFEQTANSKRLPFTVVKQIFDKHDMILLDQEYINANIPLAYVCKHHQDIGIQHMALSNAYKEYCPFCNIVKGEKRISEYLLNNNIQFKLHKSYDDLLGIKNGKLSYDFYLPKFNLLIEYQGKQHERPVDVFGGEQQFIIQKEHDKRKRDYAAKHNIDLLEIWYYDFDRIEEILNNKL